MVLFCWLKYASYGKILYNILQSLIIIIYFFIVPSLQIKRDGQQVTERARKMSRNGTVILFKYSSGNID